MADAVMGTVVEDREAAVASRRRLISRIVVYGLLGLGFAWLSVLIGVDGAWTFGVLPFILPDLIKVALAACLVPAGWSALRGLGLLR